MVLLHRAGWIVAVSQWFCIFESLSNGCGAAPFVGSGEHDFVLTLTLFRLACHTLLKDEIM